MSPRAKSSSTRPPRRLIWLSLAAGVLLPASGLAQTVTMELQKMLSPESVAGHSGNVDFTREQAGPYGFKILNSTGFAGTPLAATSEIVYLFCVEIGQHVRYNTPATWTLVSAPAADTRLAVNDNPMSANIPLIGIGSARVLNLERLYGEVFGNVYDVALLNGDQQSAFQLAVWKLSHDDNFLLSTVGTSPQFWVSGASPATLAIAQGWLDQIVTNPTGPSMSLAALNHGTAQDYLIPAALVAIPEPSTYAAVLGVAAGVVVLRRRIKRAV